MNDSTTPPTPEEPDESGMPEDPTLLAHAMREAITLYHAPIVVTSSGGPNSLSTINHRIAVEAKNRSNRLAELLGRALPFVEYHG
jgi:hypothetical protein